jgi:CCR4-NOT transcriptional complex subunit CAF120
MYSYTPPLIGAGPAENIEELAPVFSYLSSHSNKLYQEGYFLKLNDLDSSGKPNSDRNWTECFAQLVGTVLSLWDAAALDMAGQDGEVPPTFINLADASIKMVSQTSRPYLGIADIAQIETLPTRNQDVQPLQNVLSISTAGKNRYLLHFNSLHSLTQWTAGIRLSMFENSSLQELYTGSLVAGKGKHLNNIKMIMERARYPSEDWARVRFGAGTPWRRCWCVIEPPNEKEYAKANKTSLKKKSAYERPTMPKGDIKFYDTKKTKKAVPIATITDAYSAYAIYPQSKPLIDQSTLVKVEGKITIHSKPESKTEGFVFVMPEVHAAVSGFEMLLRWLFPVYDTFNLYGRPGRLVADTLDPRGLMFAMPQDRRYGYLDIIDVAGLIHTDGSERWTEREWRKQLKEITSRRMQANASQRNSSTFPRNNRQSMGSRIDSRMGARYEDNASIRSQPANQSSEAVFAGPMKAGTAPPGGPFPIPSVHNRSISENVTARSPTKNRMQNDTYRPSRMSMEQENGQRQLQQPLIPAPAPPMMSQPYRRPNGRQNGLEQMDSNNSSDTELQGPHTNPEELNSDIGELAPITPVIAPPLMHHETGDRPKTRPAERPDLRREKSRMSTATLTQMTEASRMNPNGPAAAGATAAWKAREGMGGDSTPRGVIQTPIDTVRNPANQGLLAAGMVVGTSESLLPPRRVDSGSRASSGHSIARKPLPASRNASEHSVTRWPSRDEDLPPLPPPPSATNQSIDMYSRSLVPGGAVPATELTRDRGQPENPFADTASTDSPDYASIDTRESEKSVHKPRTGALKTVGNLDYVEDSRNAAGIIPDVNFGPTQRLTPGSSRPTTPGGMPTGRKSPFGSSPTDFHTPEDKTASPHSQARGQIERPDNASRSASYNHDHRQSMVWQPGTVLGSGRQSPGPAGLTAEEFVQQRAATARLPSGYAPRRNQSSGNVERPLSGSFSKREALIRQQQRNNSPTMMQQQQGDYAAKLSAREQEHVARMTGMPLVSVPPRSRTPDPAVGLIGAIEAREQEKRNMRDGVSGQMVQAAIAQRQQQSYGPASHAQYAAQMAYGGFQGQQQYGGQQGQPQQQYYAGQQQVPWPPGQFAQHGQGQGQYYGQQNQQTQWQPTQGPQQQQRYSGYYAPEGVPQEQYRRS